MVIQETTPETTVSGKVAIEVRNAVLSWCDINSCIESTRLGLLVFKRLGIPARPQPVRVAVMNRVSWKLMHARVPFEQWPEDAYALGVGFREGEVPESGWNGHLVAIVREPGKPRQLLDISADQFDRPGQLNVPNPVGMTITKLWTPNDPAYRVLRDGNTIIEYRPFAPADPVGRVYLDTPAWNDDPEGFNAVADSIAEKLADLVSPSQLEVGTR